MVVSLETPRETKESHEENLGKTLLKNTIKWNSSEGDHGGIPLKENAFWQDENK